MRRWRVLARRSPGGAVVKISGGLVLIAVLVWLVSGEKPRGGGYQPRGSAVNPRSVVLPRESGYQPRRRN